MTGEWTFMMSAESVMGKKQTGSGRKINSLEDGRRRPQGKWEDCVKGHGGIGRGGEWIGR